MEQTFMVEYSIKDDALGNVKLTRAMNQVELGKLLLKDGVALCSIDKQKKQPYKRSKKA